MLPKIFGAKAVLVWPSLLLLELRPVYIQGTLYGWRRRCCGASGFPQSLPWSIAFLFCELYKEILSILGTVLLKNKKN